MLIQIVFIGMSLLLSFFFFLYGFNLYYLLNAARKYKPPTLIDTPHYHPSVCIQLPIFNERYVIRRLVAACASMAEKYDVKKVRIFIIDDSDDDTIAEVDKIVEEYLSKNIQIAVLRRENRQGFKAGALQYALERTAEEFIVIFDADFIPPADFLARSLPYFAHDERLGIIQSRWVHLNRNYNFLTKAIAIGIDVHFLIDQTGRFAAGCFQNFNGSGGILRKKALLEAGGWQADTLAEDLDASYRIQMQGYRILYQRDILSPAEIPPTVPSFKKQQGRWACGSLRAAKKLLPALMTDRDLGFKKRFQSFIHLTGYMVHPLMYISFVLACLATLFKIDSFRIAQTNLLFQYSSAMKENVLHILQDSAWGFLGMMILLCTISAWISPIVALRIQKLHVTRNLSSLLILFLLGCGVSLNNTIEAGKALLSNRNWSFRRTPKYSIEHNLDDWRVKRYQVPLDFESLLELVFICLGALAIGFAVWQENFGVLLILIPYTAAYAFVFILTVQQSRQNRAI